VLEQSDIPYHGVAWSNDRTKFYALSKQRASMVKDESTRSKTDAGERPELKLYLVLMVWGITATTLEEDGHTLGRISNIIVSYCAACTAGLGGTCIHCSMCSYTQYHCWGEGRPVKSQ